VSLVAALALTLGVLAAPAGGVTGDGRVFVEFTKTATSATIQAGDVAGFTITANNVGRGTATNVVITDVLPDGGLLWAETPDVAACTIAGDVLTCNVGDLAGRTSFSVTVGATTNPEVCDYVITNTATLAVDGVARKTASASITVECEPPPPPGDGCTFTQGFWKNHPEVWPVSSLSLGSVSYSAAQLGEIFDEPVAGNGLISLAHQLIAVKLNIANGADPTDVAQAVADADALIDGLVVPPVGSGFLAPGDTSTLVDALTDFNEGTSGPGHCEEEEGEE
jgi:uncharacterized repeat protein (TIGR01451 family)